MSIKSHVGGGSLLSPLWRGPPPPPLHRNLHRSAPTGGEAAAWFLDLWLLSELLRRGHLTGQTGKLVGWGPAAIHWELLCTKPWASAGNRHMGEQLPPRLVDMTVCTAGMRTEWDSWEHGKARDMVHRERPPGEGDRFAET